MAELLVVEDDDPIRKLLARIFVRDGHAVVCARHGGEAIEAMHGHGFDMMILDVMMPVANAADVLQHMRSSGHWIPTVILTAAHERQLSTMQMDGVLAVLQKPFDVESLRRTIANLAAQARATS